MIDRIAIVLCLFLCAGCSRQGDRAAPERGTDGVKDGGRVENADRDKAEAYFVAIAKVETIDDERKLLTEFGEWLKAKGYQITVTEKNGKHQLECPYFPPVTPWTEHTFLDVKNLSLLPQSGDGD